MGDYRQDVRSGDDKSSASDVANELHELISQLHQQGYTTVRTGALSRTFLNQTQRTVVRVPLVTLDIASQLVAQSMTWFARRQVKQVLVNSAVTNVNAQALYQRCGFDEKSERLVVMEHRAQVAQRTTVC